MGWPRPRKRESLMTRSSKCWLSKPRAKVMRDRGLQLMPQALAWTRPGSCIPQGKPESTHSHEIRGSPCEFYHGFCWWDNGPTETVIPCLAKGAQTTIIIACPAIGFEHYNNIMFFLMRQTHTVPMNLYAEFMCTRIILVINNKHSDSHFIFV